MTLQEFVRDSLVQITSGVSDARKQNRRIATWIQSDYDRAGSGFKAADGTPVFLVDFDVAVSASTKTDGGAGASVSVAHIFTAGGGADMSKERSEISRIRFSVPIHFTTMAEGAKDVAADNAEHLPQQ
jgi:hypothetical protein